MPRSWRSPLTCIGCTQAPVRRSKSQRRNVSSRCWAPAPCSGLTAAPKRLGSGFGRLPPGWRWSAPTASSTSHVSRKASGEASSRCWAIPHGARKRYSRIASPAPNISTRCARCSKRSSPGKWKVRELYHEAQKQRLPVAPVNNRWPTLLRRRAVVSTRGLLRPDSQRRPARTRDNNGPGIPYKFSTIRPPPLTAARRIWGNSATRRSGAWRRDPGGMGRDADSCHPSDSVSRTWHRSRPRPDH